MEPKIDGCYAEAHLDDGGRIASVRSRTGRELPEGAELLGVPAGPPRSVLVGELEAHTEAGVAAAAARGYRALHLFDALAVRGHSLAGEPYAARHAWLHEMRDDLLSSLSRDHRGRLHDESGSYLRRPDRILPIVPLIRGRDGALELWREFVERGGGEGLVAVDLRAPAGRGKRKVKVADTSDCRVLAIDGDVLRLAAPRTSPAGWRGESFLLQSSRAASLRPGAIVEVAHDGCYGSGLPRFARLVRQRADLRAP